MGAQWLFRLWMPAARVDLSGVEYHKSGEIPNEKDHGDKQSRPAGRLMSWSAGMTRACVWRYRHRLPTGDNRSHGLAIKAFCGGV